MTSPTLADIQREFIAAAEDAGWLLRRLDMTGDLILENRDHSVEMRLRGILVTPGFIRTLPDGGYRKPERPDAP